MNQPKRKVKVDMSELELAFEYQHENLLDYQYFLDLETGEVVMTSMEDRDLLERVYKKYADPETGKVDWPAVLPQLDARDWEKEMLEKVDQVESGYGTRYIAVDQDDPHAGYRDMEAFIYTVTNPHLQAKLERAISGKGAFRYFKDVLLEYPKERERWFEFQNKRFRGRILDWLESEGIEPI
jgi:hypothetical protein